MNKTRSVLIAGLAIMAIASLARSENRETGDISGCLTDSQSGLPIVGAWVAVLENNLGARTDSTGCFMIENLKPGEFNLIVTHRDYGTVQGLADLSVRVRAGIAAQVSVALSRAVREEGKKSEKKDRSFLGQIADWFGAGSDHETEKRFNAVQAPSINKPGMVGVPAPSGDARSSEIPELRVRIKHRPPGRYYPAEDDYSWPPRDMFFTDYGTNVFTDTRRDRFSTFAIDVDDASYNLARRYLQEGNMVPPDAIRVEEFINHFDYGYNVPSDEKFRVFTELTNSPFDPGKHILKIAIKGREIERRDRKPLNITLVIDVSGSMGQGNRFRLVRESVKALVGQLNGHDRVGIVAYGSNAYVVLEPVAADRHGDIFNAVDRLHPGGSTYAEAGIKLGYEMANRQFVNGHGNLVILCSDGVANVGHTSPDAIMNQIERFARRGISLNSYGYGMGNYNDVLLEQLAQKGNGRYAYINDQEELQKAFVEDFVGNMEILARDVKVQVEFNPKVVKSYRLLGYENRNMPDHRFRDNRQDGGEVGAGHEVTALYELVMPKRRSGGKVATVFVRWKNAEESEVAELRREVKWNKHRKSIDRSRPELRLAMVAGRFAEILKGTQFAEGTSFQELYRIAEPLRRELPGEQIKELLDLIRRAGDLTSGQRDRLEGDDVFSNYKR